MTTKTKTKTDGAESRTLDDAVRTGRMDPATAARVRTWRDLDERGRDAWAEAVAGDLDDGDLNAAIRATAAGRGPLALPMDASGSGSLSGHNATRAVNLSRAAALVRLKERRDARRDA